jgi:hypothetical protein
MNGNNNNNSLPAIFPGFIIADVATVMQLAFHRPLSPVMSDISVEGGKASVLNAAMSFLWVKFVHYVISSVGRTLHK